MRENVAMPAICSARTRNGEPCSNKAMPGETRCHFHLDPAHPARREAAARGGRQRSNEARARRMAPESEMTMGDVRRLLAVGMTAVLAGQLQPGVGTALAAMSRAFVSVSEAGEIEARIERIEQALAAKDAERGAAR